MTESVDNDDPNEGREKEDNNICGVERKKKGGSVSLNSCLSRAIRRECRTMNNSGAKVH